MSSSPSETLLTMVNTPMQPVGLGEACFTGIDISLPYDSVLLELVPDGAQSTVDFLLTVEGTFLDTANVLSNWDTIPSLPLPMSCVPADRSTPPNGTTNDPEDSPRIASDVNDDQLWSAWATRELQIQLPVTTP